MKNNSRKIIVVGFFVLTLVALSDPFMILMPPFAVLCSLVLVVFLMTIWAGIIIHEKATDERELKNKLDAGQASYLSGIFILTIGIVLQGLKNQIDPWLALTLGVMVCLKLITKLYFDKYR